MVNDKISKRVDTLMDKVNSFIITTYGDGIKTALGYLPFIIHDGEMYVFTSTLTEHGANLEKGAEVSIMFIEDEQDASKIPARIRATFDVDYVAVKNEEVIDRLEAEVDENYAMMRQLSDFTLYKFTRKNGRYVQGFGAAFLQDDAGQWGHMTV